MNRATYSVLFYIKRTKILKDGKVPIFARITVTGQRTEFGLQKSIELNQWDNHKCCAKGFIKQAKDLNNHLELVKNKLFLHKH